MQYTHPSSEMHSALRALFLLVALLLLSPRTSAADGVDCEALGGLPASSLAPMALLKAEDFEVDPCAELIGGMAHFVLRATGPGSEHIEPAALQVESLDLLEIRVTEMEALRRLREMGVAGTAGRAAARSLWHTGEALVGVVTRPVESVVGFPAGVLRMVGRRADRISRQVTNVGERAADHFGNEAYSAVSLRPREAASLPPEPEPWWAQGGSQALSLGQRWLGYSAARRELGLNLGLDPYSSNPWIEAEMDRLAWSALIGERGISFGLGQLGSTARTVLGKGSRIHRMVWEKQPEEVRAWNAARLAPLACSADARKAFLDNGRYTPVLQSLAVDALLELVPQQGCDVFLGLAASAEREIDARFVVDWLHLLVAAQPRFPTHFEAIGHALVLRDGEARLWLALPVDRLLWTPAVADFFAARDFAEVEDRRVIIAREASGDARSALLHAGWTVIENAIEPAREAIAERQPEIP